MKFVFDDLAKGGSNILEKATITKNGTLTPEFSYMKKYAEGQE
jgi:hypothetical protein